MKTILSTRFVEYPEDVTIDVKARVVTVTGKRGTIVREFKHLNLDLVHMKDARKIRVDLWFGNRKQLACIRTICSHIENMVTGVRVGFLYKMKFVYSHFPINVAVTNDVVEIRNFMGEKLVRKIACIPGVTAVRTKDVKDQLEISGIDITKVSLVAAQVQQMTNIRNKDLRKFLDGIYVTDKLNIEEAESE
jgi:large subunit ribosomal protein L9e